MRSDEQDERAPDRSEFIREELEPLASWLTTPASPLRIRRKPRVDRLPYYLVTCVDHPEFFTEGTKSWIEMHGRAHAKEHGVQV